MSNKILIIAHAPLAHALKACALHVFPDCGGSLLALDVHPNTAPEESLSSAKIMISMSQGQGLLVLTDIFGATPSNVAQRLVQGTHAKLVAGVNLPMLLRTVSYCNESLEMLVGRALAGGAQGVMQVANTAPQNQSKKQHDPDPNDHQQ
jgi:PTS system ascorbate-specific IIA component